MVKSLQERDLAVKVREVEASTAEFREVVSIEPEPGTWIRRGSEVSVEFSGFFVQVPNLVGMQRDEVVKSLQELHLAVKVREVEASTAEFQEVVSIEPEPGTWIRKGSEVRAEFSGFFVLVPNLVDKHLDEVVKVLEELHLSTEIHEVASDAVKHGEVVTMDPEPGTWIRRGSVVKMNVSTRFPVNVPNVENLPKDAGERILRNAGFAVEAEYIQSDYVSFDNVIRQQPSGGEAALSGGTVTIMVSGGLTEHTAEALSKEFDRLGHPETVRSVLIGGELQDYLGVQSLYGLSNKKLQPRSLLDRMKGNVRIPEFTTNDYEIVEEELDTLGLKPRKRILSQDSFNFFCAILIRTYIVKSLSPAEGSIVERGSVIRVDVHEKWNIEPDPYAKYPECTNPMYEEP